MRQGRYKLRNASIETSSLIQIQDFNYPIDSLRPTAIIQISSTNLIKTIVLLIIFTYSALGSTQNPAIFTSADCINCIDCPRELSHAYPLTIYVSFLISERAAGKTLQSSGTSLTVKYIHRITTVCSLNKRSNNFLHRSLVSSN